MKSFAKFSGWMKPVVFASCVAAISVIAVPTVDAKSLCEKFEALELADHDALIAEYKSHKDDFVIETSKARICNDLKQIRDVCPHQGHWQPRKGFVGHFKTDYCGSQCTFDRSTKC